MEIKELVKVINDFTEKNKFLIGLEKETDSLNLTQYDDGEYFVEKGTKLKEKQINRINVSYLYLYTELKTGVRVPIANFSVYSDIKNNNTIFTYSDIIPDDDIFDELFTSKQVNTIVQQLESIKELLELLFGKSTDEIYDAKIEELEEDPMILNDSLITAIEILHPNKKFNLLDIVPSQKNPLIVFAREFDAYEEEFTGEGYFYDTTTGKIVYHF